MKQLCYIGILKEGFSTCSSPVMLISRKLTKDKRVVANFRHLNVRIVKNNLAYPLLKDKFSVLGSSKCEVLSVLDLKDAFLSSRLSQNSKKYSRILPYFGSTSYLYQRMPMGLNISPQYGNLTLTQFSIVFKARNIVKQSWMTIIYPIKNFSYNEIRRFIKSIIKEWFENIPKENVNYLGKLCITWEMRYLYRTKEFVLSP